MNALLDFYRGGGGDARGRTLAEMLAWDDARLESVHDYIQWLFPLPEPSLFNAAAPLLAPADIAAFAADPALRAALARAFRRMLAFYGFAGEGGAIARAENFAARAANWLTPGNHNFLRVSRILRALTLLGLGAEARAWLGCLEALAAERASIIGPRTLAFWRQACAA